ncbi:MAG: tetratricopeptide repeat protein, partial [Bacteroidota bacterium]
MKQSLLILPFRNLGFSTEDEFLSDGITEELISTLTQQGHLRIASRTSSFYFKGKNFSLEEIKSKLEVTHILEGSIRRHAEKIRIAVHLTDTQNGFTKWSETFNLAYENLLTVQEEIASCVAKKFTPDTEAQKMPASVPNNDVVAYEYYLKGQYHYNLYTVDNMRKGVDCFEKAILRQPDFALAYAGLAHGYLGLGGYEHPAYYHKAKQAAVKSISLKEKLLEPHLSLVYIQMFYDWDWQGAAQSIQRALEINVRSAIAHRIKGVYNQVVGRPLQAVEDHEIATKHDPLNVIFLKGLARSLYLARRYEEAMTEYQKTLELDPTFHPALEGMGFISAAQGNWSEALKYFQRHQEMVGHPLKGWFGLGYVAGKTGDVDLAYDILQRHDKRKAEKPHQTLDLNFALIYLGLGQFDKVFTYLNNGVDKHHIYTIGALLSDPVFDEIRNDQRYCRILKKIGLDAYAPKRTQNNGINHILKIQSDTKEKIELVANQVLYIEAEGNYSRIVWKDQNKLNDRLLRITLSGVVKQINSSTLIQTHRSFLVNIKNMDTVFKEGRTAVLKNTNFNIDVPISRQ